MKHVLSATEARNNFFEILNRVIFRGESPPSPPPQGQSPLWPAMRKTLSVCLEPGCPTLTDQKRCPPHQRQYDQAHRGEHRSIYKTRRWQLLRWRILNAEPACRECDAPASEVDHIVSLEDGGPPYHPDNLQPLCKPCHSRKTAAEHLHG